MDCFTMILITELVARMSLNVLIYFFVSISFCYISLVSNGNSANSTNFLIFQPDPSEIDPIWEATIRNVVLNTTEFKPSKVKVIVKNHNDDEDDDEIDMSAEGDAPQISKVPVSSEVSLTISEIQPKTSTKEPEIVFDTLDDERKQQREKALRAWLEASLSEVSHKSKIINSYSFHRPLTRWARLSELLNSEIASLARAITPTITESLYSANVSSECSRDFLRLVFGVQNNQDWAWRILDSNGRLPSGLISGTSFAFGDYDQCLEFDSSSNSMASRYCLLHFSIPVPDPELRMHYKDSPQSLYYLLEQNQDTGFDPSMRKYLKRLYQAMYSTSILNGICVPGTCSSEDVQNFILSFDTFKNQSVTLAAKIEVSDCSSVEKIAKTIDKQILNSLKERLDNILKSLSLQERIAFLTAVSLFILPSILWALKQFFPHTNIPYESLLEHFSPIKNFQRLILISDHQKSSKTHFLNILRISSTLWIVVTHCAILGSYFAPSIVYRFEAEARSFSFSAIGQLFYNGYPSVEIFFFLSGFLSIRTITNRTRIPGFVNYVLFRFVRLIPAVIGLLAFFFFWPYIGSGPVFVFYNRKLIDACERSWWKTLILINNYNKSDDICLVHTWFLSADFQLHVIAYPILVAVRKGRIASARLMISFLISFGLIWSIMKLNARQVPASLNALFQLVPDEFYKDMQDLYYPTQNHFTSYFLGIATAYYLYQKKKDAYKQNVLLLAPILGFASMFFPLYWTKENSPSDVQTRIGLVYFIFSRLIHPISISCICLWALPRTSKLSSPFLTIFSRLTFSIYLVHLPIIWHFLFTTRIPIQLEFTKVLFFSGGILLFTIPIALVFHLFIEAPYSSLCSELLFRIGTNKTMANQQNSEQRISTQCSHRRRDSNNPESLRISQLNQASSSIDNPERHKMDRLWNLELEVNNVRNEYPESEIHGKATRL